MFRQPSRFADRRLGFTLVEMLVVLVLMGMIAATIVPNLAGTTRRTQTDKFIADLIDLDAKARVLAGRHQVCYFEVEETKNRITLSVIDEQAQSVQTIEIPEFVTVVLDQNTDQDRMVKAFNRLGHTSDYGYTIIVDETTIRIAFNGITGWHEILREVQP